MKCPFCGKDRNMVIDKRVSSDGLSNRRRRECKSCSKRFTTYETMEDREIYVVKKDGRREPFDKEKMLKGLRRACEKRPVEYSQLDDMVNKIIAQINDSGAREISSKKLGQMVIKELKKIDKVAYIRFASVYREFADLSSFEDELKKLSKKK